MIFWAQVALLAMAVIAFAVVVETLLTDSAFTVLEKALQFSPDRTTPSRPRVSSAALLGTAGRERSRSAGGHSRK